jgi:hypothetical protein
MMSTKPKQYLPHAPVGIKLDEIDTGKTQVPHDRTRREPRRMLRNPLEQCDLLPMLNEEP